MLETQESAPFVKWTSIPLTPITIIIVIRAFARIVPASTKLINTISKRKAAVVMDNPTNTQYNAQSIGYINSRPKCKKLFLRLGSADVYH
jgi:P pilus assembly chaperone PapD